MNRSFLSTLAPIVILALGGFWLAYQFVEPAPPTSMVLATGGPQGAYHAFGEAMHKQLAEQGIELVLRNTAGSGENMQLLASGAVDLALMQGGTPEPETAADAAQIQALASLYFEPLWVFHRLHRAPVRLSELAGARVNLGASGSGTYQLAIELAQLNQLPLDGFSNTDNATARSALSAGELDAMFVVGGPQSEEVQALLRTPGVAVMSLERAAAYHLHHRYLSSLSLPTGAIDLAANIPPQHTDLIGVTAMLVATAELHPALVDLLLLSAPEVVGGSGLFHEAGDFPSNRYLSLPVAATALRFHDRGPSFLQRYLPFWAATLIDRLVVMLVPLVALLLPLMRLFPPVYRWRVRSRIYRWYEDLDRIEKQLDNADADASTFIELAAQIEGLEAEVKRVETPLSYADELYHLRTHIELVRVRIQNRRT